MSYADQLFDLTGQTILITGGSRGLGREMAFGVARCGADVVIASRKMENCVAVAEQIESETGRAAMPYQVHVGRWEEIDGLVEASYKRFGKVDTLINNAGMSPLYDKLTDVTEKLFDAVVNLNLKGPFRLSALVGERMVAAGRGSIINVSTAGSLRLLEGRAQRDDRGLCAGTRAEGPGQHLDGRPLPHRRQQVVESGPGSAQPVRQAVAAARR
jgi:NAD(P)-dependent dehydrogenase (short-subunit alcohol dehydrogenase family)